MGQSKQSHHGAPKQIEFIARGVLTDAGRVLLCRNDKHGYWYLPGGHIECSESAAAALTREIEEELGWRVRIGPCLLIQEQIFEQRGRPRHEVTIVFHVEHSPEAPDQRSSPPTSREPGISFEWVDLAVIPDLDLRPTAQKAWLAAGGETGALDRPAWISAESA